ncbi:MAG: hypothetical protein AABY93_08650 [Bacteroidota bacterium]
MKDYKEFQFGWLIFAIIIPVQIFITYLFIYELGDRPIGTMGFIIISSIFIFVYLLFFGLTTTISADKISVVFGIGFIRRTIPINGIKSVECVKTPWYYGWGIRIFSSGMLYNISGFDGVELKFKDAESAIRIGTRDSAKLKQEIAKRLN